MSFRIAFEKAGGQCVFSSDWNPQAQITYALGQVARKYYASGRTLSAAQLKDVFANLLSTGRSLQDRYAGDIRQRSQQVNVTELLPLVQGN